MDRIVLRGIRATGRHGVSDDERATPQDFEVDLSCAVDAREAARTDDLASTIDYRRSKAIVVSEIEDRSYRLIESLAEGIARRILIELRPRWVRLKVTKLRPGSLGIPASVEIERGPDVDR